VQLIKGASALQLQTTPTNKQIEHQFFRIFLQPKQPKKPTTKYYLKPNASHLLQTTTQPLNNIPRQVYIFIALKLNDQQLKCDQEDTACRRT
jgi:hypothetical protein